MLRRISLAEGEARPLDGPTEVGTGLARPQPVPLSQLIDIVNTRFGTDFNQADQLYFDQVVGRSMANDGVRQAAAVNPGDKFELVFKGLLRNLFAERIDQNEDIFVRFMNDEALPSCAKSPERPRGSCETLSATPPSATKSPCRARWMRPRLD